MIQLLPCALALVALAVPPAASQEDAANITLGQGIQKVITVPGISRIAIGNPSVVDVTPLGANSLILLGQTEGRTTLMIWKSNGSRLSYMVSVHKKDPDKIIEEIKDILGDRDGLSLRKVGDRIILEGDALTAEDADFAARVANLYPQVVNFVRISPNAKRLLANSINAALQRAGLKNVQVSVVGNTILIEGSVESQQDLQKADLIIKAVAER